MQHLEGHSGSVQISLVVGQQLVDNVYTGIVDAGKVDLKFASPDFLADYEKWCMLRKSDVSALRAVLQPLFACAGAVESCKLMAFVEDPALHGFADVLARTDVAYEGMPVIGQLRDFIKEKITEAAAILYAAAASQQVLCLARALGRAPAACDAELEGTIQEVLAEQLRTNMRDTTFHQQSSSSNSSSSSSSNSISLSGSLLHQPLPMSISRLS